MSKLGVVEDTLFVPMLGRIYASEHCPQILYDKKALEFFWPLPPALPIWIGSFGLFWKEDRTV